MSELIKDVNKIVGKCPFCDGNLRAVGGWEKGVDIVCTNFKCQAEWRTLDE